MDWRTHAPLAVLACLLLLAYSNSFSGPFLLDNAEMIQDTRIQSVTSEHIHRIFTLRYWEGIGDNLYRPLATLSYLFNYAILGNGTNPAGYHWFNLLLHAVNMLLVYRLGLAIFGGSTGALLLSGLWGLHPVLTEAVTNVIGRTDMLAAFGVLGALLAHRNASRRSGIRKAAWLAVSALAVTAGMFSKESAIVAVAAVALWDLAFERDLPWRARIPGYAAVAAPCIAFLIVRAQVLVGLPFMVAAFTDNPLAAADFWTARITAVKVIGKYVALLLWPASLSYDYSYNEIPLFGWRWNSWEDWKAGIAVALCFAALAAALYARRRSKPLFFFILFFFAALAPVSNLLIPIGTIMGERLLYLPSIGLAGCLVCAVAAIERRLPASEPPYRTALWGVLALVGLACALRTYDRNGDWLQEGRFWASALRAAPGSFKTNVAAARRQPLVTTQGADRAIRLMQRALTILDGLPDDRNNAPAYRYAGILYRGIGDGAATRQGFAAARPETPLDWYLKSLNALLRCERIERAQEELGRRLNERRGIPGLTLASGESYSELGRTYMKLSDTPKAVAAFERGRMLGTDPDLLEELAAAYAAMGELRKAAVALVEALALDSKRSNLTAPLLKLYAEIDPGGCAESRGGLNVTCPLVHRDICTASANVMAAYGRRGQQLEAGAIRRTAVDELGCRADELKSQTHAQ